MHDLYLMFLCILQHTLHLQGVIQIDENFTSRVDFLIRHFRIAAEMTQKELADECGLNESAIRNCYLGKRY